MKVTIEQSGMIATQGRQFMIFIQKKNWSKIKQLMNKKLDVEITLQPKLD